MFVKNLFDFLNFLLDVFFGTLFSVVELTGGKKNVKIGKGGGAR
jgi:hypothetical protein